MFCSESANWPRMLWPLWFERRLSMSESCPPILPITRKSRSLRCWSSINFSELGKDIPLSPSKALMVGKRAGKPSYASLRVGRLPNQLLVDAIDLLDVREGRALDIGAG